MVTLSIHLLTKLTVQLELLAFLGAERALTERVVDRIHVVDEVILLARLVLFFIGLLVPRPRYLVALNSVLRGPLFDAPPRVGPQSDDLTHPVGAEGLDVIEWVVVWPVLWVIQLCVEP